MELFNLLEKAIPVFGQTFDVSLNWIGQLISLLVSGVGVVGVGVILFSLILKVIVLPFDIYQRVAMRKQNIKMEEQKERMEKLQKQYANDQEMYNQKVMEMYKENGISMFSSCLPMILTMVIFFAAIGGFNGYSQFSAVQNYNTMVQAYSEKVLSYCPTVESATYSIAEGKITVTDGVTATGETAYIFYRVPVGEGLNTSDDAAVKAYLETAKNKEYFIDLDKASTIEEIASQLVPNASTEGVEKTLADVAYEYFTSQAQMAVVEVYEKEVSPKTSFLWIKNVWATDAAHVHPVLPWSEFEAKAKTEKFDVNGEVVAYTEIAEKTGAKVYTEDAYNLITGKLETQKTEANGYYILIALSILTILLQQFITMRSQKAQNQYSTVDGQGASTQKMTMIMMTGMFAVFSFMYSAAFSMYLVISNVFSLASTLIINKVVDGIMEKKSRQATIVKFDNRVLSRIEAAKNAGRESAKESREKKTDKEVVKEEAAPLVKEEKQEAQTVENTVENPSKNDEDTSSEKTDKENE
ncbi:MAG: YidC/Oxa1 family membrane protein insertase [Clostridia bacterium]|nr:YidC/Oxa1 family membrane protein insertase [Clostridia bacterium]